MNIRIDKDVRIRIDKEDVIRLQNANQITQSFKIGVLNLSLQIELDSSNPISHIDYEPNRISIFLGAKDTLNLISDRGAIDGVTIDDINIQVDRWSNEKRSRHEDLKKGSHN